MNTTTSNVVESTTYHRPQSLTNRKVKIKNSSATHSPAHYSANTHVNIKLVCNSLLQQVDTHSQYQSQPSQPGVVYFLAQIKPIFPKFWLFCREFAHFLVHFLQAQIVLRSTKIYKYQVCGHYTGNQKRIKMKIKSPSVTS